MAVFNSDSEEVEVQFLECLFVVFDGGKIASRVGGVVAIEEIKPHE